MSTTRILMVTPLDYDGNRNTEHGMVQGLMRQGCECTVLYKRMNRSRRPVDLLRDTCTLSIHESHDGEARRLRVDPLFNYFAGLKVQMDSESGPHRTSWRQRIVRLVWPLSILRDVLFLPCFLLAALLKLRGRYDIGIGFGPWGSLVVWVLRQFGIVGAFIYQDRDFEPGLMPDRIRRGYTAWLERFLLRRADRVISIGQRLADLRRTQCSRPLDVVPTGVYHDRFAPARAAACTEPTLIYVGNLISWSGLDLAISALPRIRRAVQGNRQIIVGAGLPS